MREVRTDPWPRGERTLIKVCGFTREEEARAAVEAGVDALGFNFYARSRRALPWPWAAEWIDRLPRAALRVAVLVRPTLAEMQDIASSGLFDLLQFHGGEPADFCRLSPLPSIRAAVATDAAWPEFAASTWLVDAAATPGEYGGTGRLADWEAAAALVRHHPQQRIFLAGGLNPHNVAEALRQVRPHGVDVAGGVESAPGRKDPALISAFVHAVRNAAFT